MSLKALNKLRGYADVKWDPWPEARDHLRAMLDAIEAEIAERYMELPVDAHGVPIHVGDAIEYPNGRRDVVRFITFGDSEPTLNEGGWMTSRCYHVKPRTLEDVLSEYAFKMHDAYNDPYVGEKDRADVLSMITDDYAAELRELMGGGE